MDKNKINKGKNKNKFKFKKDNNKEDKTKKMKNKLKNQKKVDREKGNDRSSKEFKNDEKEMDVDKIEESNVNDNLEDKIMENKSKNDNEVESENYDTNDSNVVFIGNVPLTIKTKSDLVKKLNLDPKIVQSVHFRSLPIHPKYAHNKKIGVIKKKFSNVKDNQNAYVKLTDVKYMDELLKKNTMEVDGHHIFINTNNSDEFSKFSRKKTIFVGRLPPSTSEDELYNVFMNISPVKGVRIVRDPTTMKSKGFGFVAFDNRMAVTEAIREFHNTQFKGYTLNVTKCLDEKTSKERREDTRKNKKKNVKKTENKKKRKKNRK